MSSRRIRQMAHPIVSMRFPIPGRNTRFTPPHPPFWKQNLSKGKFLVPDRLRDSPDWTYSDGRPAPLNDTQLYLKKTQMELAKSIVQGLKDIREAEAEFKESEKKNQQEREALDRLKPRPKGSAGSTVQPTR